MDEILVSNTIKHSLGADKFLSLLVEILCKVHLGVIAHFEG